MKILFLDIDGVLNSMEDFVESKVFKDTTVNFGLSVISRQKLAMLQHIVEETGCKIVVSSSWRKMYSLDEIHQNFCRRGWTLSRDIIIDRTPDLRSGFRGHEIVKWMEKYNSEGLEEITSFAILDDDSDFQEELRHVFVHTKGVIGMTFHDMEKTISILNGTVVQKNDNYMCSRNHEPDDLLLKELAYDLGLPITEWEGYHDAMSRIRKVHDKIARHYGIGGKNE